MKNILQFIKKGFTLTELIIVLAIIAILAAAGTPTILAIIEDGHQRNRMNIARTIYLAAQNQLTEMRVLGRLDDWVSNPNAANLGTFNNGTWVPNTSTRVREQLGDNVPGWNDTDEMANYVHFISVEPGDFLTQPNNPVVQLLRPVLTYQEVLNDAILIEFNIRTGVVLSVFYSDRIDNAFTYGGGGHAWDNVSGQRGWGYADYEALRRNRRQGFYGVGETGSLPPEFEGQLIVNLHDSFYSGIFPGTYLDIESTNRDNMLFARITVPGSMLGADVRAVFGNYIDVSIGTEVSISFDPLSVNNTSPSLDPNNRFFREDTNTYDAMGRTIIWVLDYVAGNTASLTHGIGTLGAFSPTANIVVQASSMGRTAISNPRHPYVGEGFSANTFTINSARHLYNIRHIQSSTVMPNSGLNFVLVGKESNDLSNPNYLDLRGLPNNNITHFEPIPDFNHTFRGVANNGGLMPSLIYLRVGVSTSLPTNAGLFKNIDDDGRVEHISFVTAQVNGSDNVGVVAGVSSGQINNITVINPQAQGSLNVGAVAGRSDGQISNVTVINPQVQSSMNAGALVGTIPSYPPNVPAGEIRNFTILNPTVVVDGAANGTAGGAVGSVMHIGGVVEGGFIHFNNEVTNPRIHGEATGSSVGGFVGENSGILRNSVFVSAESTPRVSGYGTRGGMVGYNASANLSNLSNLVMLAVAPEYGGYLRPIIGRNGVNENGLNDENDNADATLLYLAGMGLRPEGVLFNLGTANLGRFYDTLGIRDAVAAWSGWTESTVSEEAALLLSSGYPDFENPFNDIYPYALFGLWPVMAGVPFWPITTPSGTITIADIFYFERYGTALGLYNPFNDLDGNLPLQDNVPVTQAGYAVILSESRLAGVNFHLYARHGHNEDAAYSYRLTLSAGGGTALTGSLAGYRMFEFNINDLRTLLLGNNNNETATPLYLGYVISHLATPPAAPDVTNMIGYIHPLFARAINTAPIFNEFIVRTPWQMQNIPGVRGSGGGVGVAVPPEPPEGESPTFANMGTIGWANNFNWGITERDGLAIGRGEGSTPDVPVGTRVNETRTGSLVGSNPATISISGTNRENPHVLYASSLPAGTDRIVLSDMYVRLVGDFTGININHSGWGAVQLGSPTAPFVTRNTTGNRTYIHVAQPTPLTVHVLNGTVMENMHVANGAGAGINFVSHPYSGAGSNVSMNAVFYTTNGGGIDGRIAASGWNPGMLPQFYADAGGGINLTMTGSTNMGGVFFSSQQLMLEMTGVTHFNGLIYSREAVGFSINPIDMNVRVQPNLPANGLDEAVERFLYGRGWRFTPGEGGEDRNHIFVQERDINFGYHITADADTGLGSGSERYNVVPGTFNGIYRGGGHRISNVRINPEGDNPAGLFAHNEGLIENLMLVNFTVSGGTYAGAVSGRNSGTISGVLVLYADGETPVAPTGDTHAISGTTAAGGIVGRNEGVLRDSMFMSTAEATHVRGSGVLGGLVGTLTDGGTMERLMMLAVAPENENAYEELVAHPITGSIAPAVTLTDAIQETLIFLSGTGIRPILPSYNIQHNQVGTPLTTVAVMRSETVEWMGWNDSPLVQQNLSEAVTDEAANDPTNFGITYNPYPMFGAWAAAVWPIVSGDADIAEILYFERYYHEIYGYIFGFYPADEANGLLPLEHNRPVLEAGYVGLLVESSAPVGSEKTMHVAVYGGDWEKITGRVIELPPATVGGEARRGLVLDLQDMIDEAVYDNDNLQRPLRIYNRATSGEPRYSPNAVVDVNFPQPFVHPFFAQGVHSNQNVLTTFYVRTPWQMNNINEFNTTAGLQFYQTRSMDFNLITGDRGYGSGADHTTVTPVSEAFLATRAGDVSVATYAMVRNDFAGTYDGLGHSISGLNIHTLDGDSIINAGLFARVATGGTVQNLVISNPRVTALGNVGAVAGYSAGTVAGVVVRYGYNREPIQTPMTWANVIGHLDETDETNPGAAGSIIGRNTGTLRDSMFISPAENTHIIGNGSVGGLVGHHSGAELKNVLMLAMAPGAVSHSDNTNIRPIAGMSTAPLSDTAFFLSGVGRRPFRVVPDAFWFNYPVPSTVGNSENPINPGTPLITMDVRELDWTGWELPYTTIINPGPVDALNPLFPYPLYTGVAGVNVSLQAWPWPIVVGDIGFSIFNFFYYEEYADTGDFHISSPMDSLIARYLFEDNPRGEELMLRNDARVLSAGYLIVCDGSPLPEYISVRRQDTQQWVTFPLRDVYFEPARNINEAFPATVRVMRLSLARLYSAYTAGTGLNADITRTVPSGLAWTNMHPELPLEVSAGHAHVLMGTLHPLFANAIYHLEPEYTPGSVNNVFEIRTPWQLNNINHVMTHSLHFRQTRNMTFADGPRMDGDGPGVVDHSEPGFHRGARFILTDRLDPVMQSAVIRGSNGTTMDAIPFFNGTFDGNYFEIHNIVINAPTVERGGLFTRINQNAVIKNVTLVNADMTLRNNLGAIAAENRHGRLYNNAVLGSRLRDSERDGLTGSYLGGITAINFGEIENNIVSALYDEEGALLLPTIIGRNDISQIRSAIGGITGHNSAEGTIVDNYVTSVIFPGNASTREVGGLAGWNYGRIYDNTVTNINITGNALLGGITGQNEPTGIVEDNIIRRSAITGAIGGVRNDFGGIAGINNNGKVINNTVEAISINNGGNNTGGVVGSNGGEVVNNTVLGASITSNANNIGGIVGNNTAMVYSNTVTYIQDGTTFTPTRVMWDATGGSESTNIGGIVGNNATQQSIVENNSVNAAHVRGNRRTGGVAGLNVGSVINNTVTGADILGSIRNRTGGTGGIVGENRATGRVNNNTLAGSNVFSASYFVGGIVGSHYLIASNEVVEIINNIVMSAPSNTVYTRSAFILNDRDEATVTGETARVFTNTSKPLRTEITTLRHSVGGIAGEVGRGAVVSTGNTNWIMNITDNLVEDTDVSGQTNVGGIVGRTTHLFFSANCQGVYNIHRNTVDNALIEGRNHVGGIIGDINTNESPINARTLTHVRYGRVVNTELHPRNIDTINNVDTHRFGGIVGRNYAGFVERSSVEFTTVRANRITGGIVGDNRGLNATRRAIVRDVSFISMVSPTVDTRELPVYSYNRESMGGIVGLNRGVNVEVIRSFFLAPAPRRLTSGGELRQFPIIGAETPANYVMGRPFFSPPNTPATIRFEANFYLSGSRHSLNAYAGATPPVAWHGLYNLGTEENVLVTVGGGMGLITDYFDLTWLNMQTNQVLAAEFANAWVMSQTAYPYPIIRAEFGWPSPRQWPVVSPPASVEQFDRPEPGSNLTNLPSNIRGGVWVEQNFDLMQPVNFVNGSFQDPFLRGIRLGDAATAEATLRGGSPIAGAVNTLTNHNEDRLTVCMSIVNGWNVRPVNHALFSSLTGNTRWHMMEIQRARPSFTGSNATGAAGSRLDYAPAVPFRGADSQGNRIFSNHDFRSGPNPTTALPTATARSVTMPLVYAELNAEAATTIYQVLPAAAGEQFFYSFYHMSRGSHSDRMYLFLTGVPDVEAPMTPVTGFTVEDRARAARRDDALVLVRPAISPRTQSTAAQLQTLTRTTPINDTRWNVRAWETIAYGPVDLRFHNEETYSQWNGVEVRQNIPAGDVLLFDLWIGTNPADAGVQQDAGTVATRSGFGISFWMPNTATNRALTIGNNTAAQAGSSASGPTATRIPLNGITLAQLQSLNHAWVQAARTNAIGFWGVEYGWKLFYGMYRVPENAPTNTEFAFQARQGTRTGAEALTMGNYLSAVAFETPPYLTIDSRVINRADNPETASFVLPGEALRVELTLRNHGEMDADRIVINNQLYPFHAYVDFAGNRNVRMRTRASATDAWSGWTNIDSEIVNTPHYGLEIDLISRGTRIARNAEVQITFDIDVRHTVAYELDGTQMVPIVGFRPSTLGFFFRNQAVVNYSIYRNSPLNRFTNMPLSNTSRYDNNFVYVSLMEVETTITPEISPKDGEKLFDVTFTVANRAPADRPDRVQAYGFIYVMVPPGFEVEDLAPYMETRVQNNYTIVIIHNVGIDDVNRVTTHGFTMRYTGTGFGLVNLAAEYRFLVQDGDNPINSDRMHFPSRTLGIRPVPPEDGTLFMVDATYALDFPSYMLQPENFMIIGDVPIPEVVLLERTGTGTDMDISNFVRAEEIGGNFTITTSDFNAILNRGNNMLEISLLTDNLGPFRIYFMIDLTMSGINLDSRVAYIYIQGNAPLPEPISPAIVMMELEALALDLNVDLECECEERNCEESYDACYCPFHGVDMMKEEEYYPDYEIVDEDDDEDDDNEDDGAEDGTATDGYDDYNEAGFDYTAFDIYAITREEDFEPIDTDEDPDIDPEDYEPAEDGYEAEAEAAQDEYAAAVEAYFETLLEVEEVEDANAQADDDAYLYDVESDIEVLVAYEQAAYGVDGDGDYPEDDYAGDDYTGEDYPEDGYADNDYPEDDYHADDYFGDDD